MIYMQYGGLQLQQMATALQLYLQAFTILKWGNCHQILVATDGELLVCY